MDETNLSVNESTNFKNMSGGNETVFAGLKQVIYESYTELVVSLLCLFLSVLVAVISQLMVIVSIVRTPSLHEPHFYILLTCCVADIVTAITSTIGIAVVFLQEEREWLCQLSIASSAIISIFLGGTLKVAVIAYERFVYFVQPFKYLNSFTSRRIAGYVTAPYIVSIAWVVITNFTHGREFHASFLACRLPFDPLLFGIQVCIFLAPPTVMSVFTIIRVLELTRKVSPGVTSSPEVSPNSAMPVQQMRRAVRMLLLMSGTFWLAVLPGHVAHVAVFASGLTWDDVDSRRSRVASLVIRFQIWLYICFQPVLNPFIYLYSRRDLRIASRRMLCKNNRVSTSMNTETTA